MKKTQPEYLSYLLRLWHPGNGKSWHVMLEQVGTGERHGFATLEELFAFLKQQVEKDKNKYNEYEHL
ncbi:MAG: hypothetical protein JW981_09945 [Anaerolineae bacterium]|nr:hypothetical protein [Anaerolineae bacterium]